MPVKSGMVERVVTHLHKIIDIPAGRMVVHSWSDHLPRGTVFLGNRIRMEILSASPGDVDWLKRYGMVKLEMGSRNYYDGPLSSLLLEDWLRKAVEKISAESGNAIREYLNDVLVEGRLQLGAIEQEAFMIETLQAFKVLIFSEPIISLSDPVQLRVILDGPAFRPIE